MRLVEPLIALLLHLATAALLAHGGRQADALRRYRPSALEPMTVEDASRVAANLLIVHPLAALVSLGIGGERLPLLPLAPGDLAAFLCIAGAALKALQAAAAVPGSYLARLHASAARPRMEPLSVFCVSHEEAFYGALAVGAAARLAAGSLATLGTGAALITAGVILNFEL
ncbi:MAG: hypothetical protein WCN81_01950 [Actinomycetes bacterium]